MAKRTPEEIKARLQKLKGLNQIIAQRVATNKGNIEILGEDDDNVYLFDQEPKPFTNKQLEAMASKNDQTIENAEVFHKYHVELLKLSKEGATVLNPCQGNNLERIAAFAMDLSYINHEEGSVEYNNIIQKNEQTIESLKSVENRQTFVESKLRELLQMDLTVLLTGSIEERIEFCKDHPAAVDLMFLSNDIASYYENLGNNGQTINKDLLDAFNEKRTLFQQAGGTGSLVDAYSSELYPLISNLSNHDIGSLNGILDASNYQTARDIYYDGTQTPETQLLMLVNKALVGLQNEVQVELDRDVYKVLSENHILDGGKNGLKYQAVDKDGNPISFETAVNTMKSNTGAAVSFRERTQAEIEYILGNGPQPKPEEKYKNHPVTFVGKHNITALADFIKEKTGLDPLEAVNNGFLNYGTASDRLGLVKPEENEVKTILEIYKKVEEGQKIFISHNGDDTKDYEITFEKGQIKEKELVPEKQYNLAQKSFKVLCDNINGTGKGFNDSKEFNAFKKFLNDAVEKGLPSDVEKYKEFLTNAKLKAFDYVYAKLEQSHNERRATRFIEAAKTMEIVDAFIEGRKPELENVHANIIAIKATKSMLTTMQKSKEQNKALLAKSILANKQEILKKVDSLKNNDNFKEYITNNKENLEVLSKNKSKVLENNIRPEERAINI